MANSLPVFSNLRLFTYIQHSVETMLSLPQDNNLSVSELFIVFSSGTKVNIKVSGQTVSQVNTKDDWYRMTGNPQVKTLLD